MPNSRPHAPTLSICERHPLKFSHITHKKPGFFKKPGFSVPHSDEKRYIYSGSDLIVVLITPVA